MTDKGSIVWGHAIADPDGRFWSKVDRSGGEDACWPWSAGVNRKGYGQFQISTRSHRPATHVALTLAGQPRPSKALCLHSCDNPRCVNPKHLRWGTAADNAADRDARDRFTAVRGEDRTQAKLTNQMVLNIVRDSRSHRETAEAFGVSKSLVFNIRTGKAWRHVTGL